MGLNEQKICVSDEDTFNDQSDESIDHMIPVLSFTPSFTSGRSTDRSVHSRLYETRPGHLMPRGPGSITLDSYFAGAQVDTASGALAHTWQTKLLGDGLGGSDLTQVGGVAGATATATAMPNATGTRVRGGIVRVGIAGDERAEGQAAVIGNPSTALLTGLPVAPSAADVIRACIMLFPLQTLGTSKRFLFEHTADDEGPDLQYKYTGCHLASWTLSQRSGDLLRLSLTYNYAYWQESDISTPDEDDLEDCNAATSDGGSYFLGPVGTAARPTNAEEEAPGFELTCSMGLVEQEGEVPGIIGCKTRGWKRTKPAGEPAATLRIQIPRPSDGALAALYTSYDKSGSQSDAFQFLATCSVGEGTAASEGRHISLFAPNMYRIGERIPPVDYNTLTYLDLMFGLREGPDTTSPLTRSFLRIGVS